MTSEPDNPSHDGTRITPDRTTLRRAIAASAMGNTTEWFDYGVYAYAAVYIGQAFFPRTTPPRRRWAASLVFAVSFLIRPLGGLVWGPLGRPPRPQEAVLATTILLMAGATLLRRPAPRLRARSASCAPIGLLILLRMVQGFSTGGEYGGAATFMAEYAPRPQARLLRELPGVRHARRLHLRRAAGARRPSGSSGSEAMADWGWRLPFLVAGPLGLVGIYLRSQAGGHPVLPRAGARRAVSRAETKTEFRDLLGRVLRGQLLLMGGLVVALNVVNYTLLSYMPTYLQAEIGLELRRPRWSLIIIGQLIMMAAAAVSGGAVRPGRPQAAVVGVAGRAVRAGDTAVPC